MIKKQGGKFVVKNKNGTKNLSKPMSKKQAEKRLGQIEWFKNHPKKG